MRRNVVLANLVVIGAGSVVQAEPAAPVDVATTSGPAFAVGVGYQSPVLGAQIDYYFVTPAHAIGVAVYVGGGWFPGAYANGIGSPSSFGPAGGVLAFFGRRHRGFLDLSYGAGAAEAEETGGEITKHNLLYGPTVAAGYEYMRPGGFFVRASFGVNFLVGDVPSNSSSVLPTLNLALGVKL